MYNLAIDEKKKEYLDTALSLYLEELEAIAKACTSRKLKENFETQATEVGNLIYIVRQTVDTRMADSVLIVFIKDHLSRGDKISAIKLVREQRNLGLKEAKDFVDNLQ